MSRKTKATHADTLKARAEDEKRRKKLGIIPMSELESIESDRTLAQRLGLKMPTPSPPDPDAIVFSKRGLMLPPFTRRGLTVRRA